MSKNVTEILKHFSDPNFKFDEEAHSYTYINQETGKPTQIFEPVSGFIGQFKEPFDAEKIAGFVAKSRKQPKAEILAEWEKAGSDAREIGTNTHNWIEDYYNGNNPVMPICENTIIRVDRFKELHEETLHKFKPLVQELRVWSKEWGIAGTLDGLFELSGKYYVGDYKTNKEFTHDKHPKGRKRRMLAPFNDLYDNHLNGYSLQVSTYRLLLEKAGFETHGAFLAHVGPNESKMYKALDLRKRLEDFLVSNNFGIL